MGITCNTTSLLPKYLVPPSTAASTYPIFGLSKEQSSHSSPTLSHQSRNISSPLGSQQPGTDYEKLLASTDLEPLETAT